MKDEVEWKEICSSQTNQQTVVIGQLGDKGLHQGSGIITKM